MSIHNHEIGSIIYRINKLHRVNVQNAVSQFGMTADQWIVLNRIVSNSGVYNQKELAEVCYKETAAITRMLDLMISKGWVEKRKSPSDKRVYMLYATETGTALIEQCEPYIMQTEYEMNKNFNKEEIETVKTLLLKLEKGLLVHNVG